MAAGLWHYYHLEELVYADAGYVNYMNQYATQQRKYRQRLLKKIEQIG